MSNSNKMFFVVPLLCAGLIFLSTPVLASGDYDANEGADFRPEVPYEQNSENLRTSRNELPTGSLSQNVRVLTAVDVGGSDGEIVDVEIELIDTDGDGIPDADEMGDDPDSPRDSDQDGTPDHEDTNSDDDSLSDAEEVGEDPENPIDTDNDGTPDYLDEDSDNDGIDDITEQGLDPFEEGPQDPKDSDNDGTPDYLDRDSDNDGVPDILDPEPTDPKA